MVSAKDCYTLATYYSKGYEKLYGKKPTVNQYKARWGFDAILHGNTMDETKALLDYYFTTPRDRLHDLDWFFNNYEKLYGAMTRAQADKDERKRLAEETRKRAEAWEGSSIST